MHFMCRTSIMTVVFFFIVKVPSYAKEASEQQNATNSFSWFCDEIPVFKLIGRQRPIDNARFVNIYLV